LVASNSTGEKLSKTPAARFKERPAAPQQEKKGKANGSKEKRTGKGTYGKIVPWAQSEIDGRSWK